MNDTNRVDRARREALRRIDTGARNFWLTLAGTFVVEVTMIFGFIQLADFTDRIHVLIFWSMLTMLTVMVLGLTILAAHVSRQTRLVLRALEVTELRQ